MSDEQAKKDELLRLLSGVDPEAARIEAICQRAIEAARLSRDVASPTREIISHLPSGSLSSQQMQTGIEAWEEWHSAARQVQTSLMWADAFQAATSGAVNTTMSGPITWVTASPPPPVPVQHARTQLNHALERAPVVANAKASMLRLGLDHRAGNWRTPLDLLEQASAALAMPIVEGGGGVSVLITLRECIDAVLAELLRRRHTQEPTPKAHDKVNSLGRHFYRPMVSPGHFQRLAADVGPLRDNLSAGKQG